MVSGAPLGEADPELNEPKVTRNCSGRWSAARRPFVGKDAPAREVVAAARHAAVSPHTFMASNLGEVIKRRMQESATPPLSPREFDVLELLVDGFAVRQIVAPLVTTLRFTQ